MKPKSSGQSTQILVVSIGLLILIVALPLLLAQCYQPNQQTHQPQVAGAQTPKLLPIQSQNDLNLDGQVDILDYTILTSQYSE